MKVIYIIFVAFVVILNCASVLAVGSVTVTYNDGTSETYGSIEEIIEYYSASGDLIQIRLIPISRADSEIVIGYDKIRLYKADRMRVKITRIDHSSAKRKDRYRRDRRLPSYDNGYGYGNFVKMPVAPFVFNDGTGFYKINGYVYTRTRCGFYIGRGFFIDNATGAIFYGSPSGRGYVYTIVGQAGNYPRDYSPGFESKEDYEKWKEEIIKKSK